MEQITPPNAWAVERRGDGAVLVRVPSTGSFPNLPDAVFAFRVGDPQFEFWSRRLADGFLDDESDTLPGDR